MSPRGVRFLAGNSGPARPASSTDEKKGKSGSEIVVYPNADHGFHADYRPSFNKEASEDAWKKLLAWFKKNGAA